MAPPISDPLFLFDEVLLKMYRVEQGVSIPFFSFGCRSCDRRLCPKRCRKAKPKHESLRAGRPAFNETLGLTFVLVYFFFFSVDVGEESPRTVCSGLVGSVPLEELQVMYAVGMRRGQL